MQKKNVLGTDPLKWLKEDKKKEEKKKENTESPKSDIDSQGKQAETPLETANVKKETGVKQQVEKPEEKLKKQPEQKTFESVYVSETLKSQERKVSEPVKKTEPYSRQEERAFETSDITEANRRAVLGKDAYGYHTKSRDTTQKDSPATAFVIVYTVLLLILGFIVYRDLTKQIDKLEAKLEVVEKKLDEGMINYEDTKLDDVW